MTTQRKNVAQKVEKRRREGNEEEGSQKKRQQETHNAPGELATVNLTIKQGVQCDSIRLVKSENKCLTVFMYVF